MNLEKTGTIIAIIVGILGITQTLFQILKEIYKERRKIIVFCEKTIEKWPDEADSINPNTLAFLKELSPTYEAITIRAINNGRFPIVITKAGFHLTNGEKIEKTGKEIGLPKRIEVGESVSIPFRIATLQRDLTEQPERFRTIKEIYRKILLFLNEPRIGNYRFRSPIYIDYVYESETPKSKP